MGVKGGANSNSISCGTACKAACRTVFLRCRMSECCPVTPVILATTCLATDLHSNRNQLDIGNASDVHLKISSHPNQRKIKVHSTPFVQHLDVQRSHIQCKRVRGSSIHVNSEFELFFSMRT